MPEKHHIHIPKGHIDEVKWRCRRCKTVVAPPNPKQCQVCRAEDWGKTADPFTTKRQIRHHHRFEVNWRCRKKDARLVNQYFHWRCSKSGCWATSSMTSGAELCPGTDTYPTDKGFHAWE